MLSAVFNSRRPMSSGRGDCAPAGLMAGYRLGTEAPGSLSRARHFEHYGAGFVPYFADLERELLEIDR
jgi:hydrogenase/urease accessory protein HupE